MNKRFAFADLVSLLTWLVIIVVWILIYLR